MKSIRNTSKQQSFKCTMKSLLDDDFDDSYEKPCEMCFGNDTLEIDEDLILEDAPKEFSEESDMIDVKSSLSKLFKVFHEICLINPLTTEEEFCAITIEDFDYSISNMNLPDCFVKAIFGLVSGKIKKRKPKEIVFENVPLIDNDYYINSSVLRTRKQTLQICREHKNVLYLRDSSGKLTRINAKKFYNKTYRKSTFKFTDQAFLNRDISWYMLKALVDELKEPMPKNAAGMVFNGNTKTWRWNVSNDVFLKVLGTFTYKNSKISFINLFFNKLSREPYKIIDGKYVKYCETNGGYSIQYTILNGRSKGKTCLNIFSKASIEDVCKRVCGSSL